VDSGVSEDSGSSHSEEDEEKKPTKSKGNWWDNTIDLLY
jgi:hypothetical protein